MNERNTGNLTLGKLIINSFEIIKEKIADILIIGAIFILIPATISEMFVKEIDVKKFIDILETKKDMSNWTANISYTSIPFTIVTLLLAGVGTTAIIYIISEKTKGNDISFKDSLKYILSRIKDIIILKLALLLIYILVGAVITLMAYFFINRFLFGGALLVVILSVIVFAFIGIYKLFATQSMIIDNLNVINSFRRSYYIVKGRFGDVFLKALIIGLLSGFMTSVITNTLERIPLVSILSSGVGTLIYVYLDVAITLMFIDYNENDKILEEYKI